MNITNLLLGVVLTQTWTTYTPENKQFSAVFPGKVESQSTDQVEAGQKVKTTIYVGQSKDGLACILSSTVIPKSMKATERAKMNDGIVFGFLNSSKFSKVSEKQSTFTNYSGRYVKVKRGTAEGALWIVTNGDTIYTLTAVAKSGDSSPIEKKFFNSFKIKK